MCADAGCDGRPGATGLRVLRSIVARAVSIADGKGWKSRWYIWWPGGVRPYMRSDWVPTGRGEDRFLRLCVRGDMRSDWVPPGAARIGFCDCVRRDTVLYSTACANRKTGLLTILGKRESALPYYYCSLVAATFDRDASDIVLWHLYSNIFDRIS